MLFLLKNGPNSNKVGKGHILPLNFCDNLCLHNVWLLCSLVLLVTFLVDGMY